jgi:adenylate cyclase
VLARFEAAVDALACATSIQVEIAQSNADVAPERRLEFRIGVNLGDVIDDRGDVCDT